METISFKNFDFKVIETLASRGEARCLHVQNEIGVDSILKIVDVGRLTKEESQQLVEHFQKVVQLVPSLKRDHIEIDLHQNFLYLLKHYTPGMSLDRIDSKLTHLQIASLARQALEQLIDLHDYGLMHGDIKPSNIIISDDHNQLILIDHAFLDPKLHLNGQAKSRAVGTVAYSAPEQSGLIPRVIDHRADLYSLGIVLLELVSKERGLSTAYMRPATLLPLS